jgi:thiosulfate/3-mercaptopyruvate sulfurtransferase
MIYDTIISTHDLEAHLHDEHWTIIDCRHSLDDTQWGRRGYIEAHIPGAFFAHVDEDLSGEIIPWKTGRHPLPDDFEDFSKQLGKWNIDNTQQVVIYDQSHGGIASRLWWMLNFLGHKRVAVLDGGWQKWQLERKQTDDSVPEEGNAKFLPSMNTEMIALMDEVRHSISQPGKLIIDSRAAPRYAGIEEPIDPIAGHIPSARNFPFLENVDENHVWKSPAFVQHRFEALYAQYKPEDIMVHCGSGVTACQNILAMKYAGFPMPKLYPGSWSEWITRKDNPVEVSANEASDPNSM